MGALFRTHKDHQGLGEVTLGGVLGRALRQGTVRLLVRGIMRLACRICHARPDRGCDYEHPDYGPGTALYQLTSEPPHLYAHEARVQDAIDAGHVRYATVMSHIAEGSQAGLRPPA